MPGKLDDVALTELDIETLASLGVEVNDIGRLASATYPSLSIFDDPREFLKEATSSDKEIGRVNCPELSIDIQGVPVTALVDTGSQVTCLSAKFYNEHIQVFRQCPKLPLTGVQATGFCGEKSSILKFQITALVKIGNAKFQLIFIVIPKLIRPCILGIDSMTTLGLVIDVNLKNMTLGNDVFPFSAGKVYEEDRAQIERAINGMSAYLDCENVERGDGPLISGIYLQNEEIAEKIQTTQNLTQEEQERLRDLIREFHNIFRKEPGRLSKYEYAFQIERDDSYFRKTYPIPFHHRAAVDEEINRMLEHDIIELSNSNYINPLVVVKKKSGDVRVCLDARELNKRIKMDHEGVENIDEIFAKCQGVKYMSSLDLNNSYWQIPLAEQSRWYTAFIYEGRCYQFKVMPFGTKVSGAALSRGIRSAFKELLHFIIDFVDDFPGISETFYEHITHLRKIFARCQSDNRTLNFEKLELPFLGYILTTNGISADSKKVDKIINFPPPRNVKQLQDFFGLVNFYSRFTYRLADEMVVLFNLLKNIVNN